MSTLWSLFLYAISDKVSWLKIKHFVLKEMQSPREREFKYFIHVGNTKLANFNCHEQVLIYKIQIPSCIVKLAQFTI